MILNGRDHSVEQLVARANSAWLVLEMHAPFLPNDMLENMKDFSISTTLQDVDVQHALAGPK